MVKRVGDTLHSVATNTEANVLYEKMYVAAHCDGIRVFDIGNPEAPVQTGSMPFLKFTFA